MFQSFFQTPQTSTSQEEEWTCVDVRFQAAELQNSVGVVSRPTPECDDVSSITLFVNGVQKKITNVDGDMTLVTFLREQTSLSGTKVNCAEGGCGACAVVLSYTNSSGELEHRSCNACLRPLIMCDGMSVTTTEGIGNHKGGYHPIQQRLADDNGSQCGYCSPGMVMAMYGLIKEKKGGPITQQEVEDRLDGNLCRCTGYFGILNAFKTFAEAGGDTDSDTDDDEDDTSNSTLIPGVRSKLKNKKRGGGCGAGGACCGGSCGAGTATKAVSRAGGAAPVDLEDVIMNPGVEKPFPEQLRRRRATPGAGAGGSGAAAAAAAASGEGASEAAVSRPKKLRLSDGSDWYRPTSLQDVLAIAANGVAAGQGVKLVGGNTSRGVWRSLGIADDATVRIDLRDVSELHSLSVAYPPSSSSSSLPPRRRLQGSVDPIPPDTPSPTGSLTFGAAVTLSVLLSTLEAQIAVVQGGGEGSGTADEGSVNGFVALVKHLKRVAGVHVRNVGSWAGNLSMALNQGFPSDVATMMAAAGARVTYYPTPSAASTITTSVLTFLALKDNNPSAPDPVLLSLDLPFCGVGEYLATYKSALRSRNAHALINAGFRVSIDSSTPSSPVITAASVVYGAVNTRHAVSCPLTESLLIGRELSQATLDAALNSLSAEVSVDREAQYDTPSQPQGKQAYRESLVGVYFYKFFLRLIMCATATGLDPSLVSAAEDYVRRVGAERHVYDVDAGAAPLNQPMPKRSAVLQAAGEAKYSADGVAGALFGALVVSGRALATLEEVNVDEALAMPGVVDFVSAADIPGLNNVGMFSSGALSSEPVFATDSVHYVGQPIGMIVASSRHQALAAADAVRVTYGDCGVAITTFEAAEAAGAYYPSFTDDTIVSGDVEGALAAAERTVEGEVSVGNMRHFYMETHSTVAIPDEDRIQLRCATQSPDFVRMAVSMVLGVGGNKVSLQTRRLGGAYGGKITRATCVAAAAAVGCAKLQQPVVLQLSMQTDTQMSRGRPPVKIHYNVGFDSTGLITALHLHTQFLMGWVADSTVDTVQEYQRAVDGCYYIPNFKAEAVSARANLPPITSLRGPGHMQAVVAIETVIEEVAAALNVPAEQIRDINMYRTRNAITPLGYPLYPFSLPDVWSRVKVKAKWEQLTSSVAEFNAANKWRKRGACMVPVKYGVGWIPTNALVTVQADGSVFVYHGHVEMGQGIHQRVLQVVADALGCAVSTITVNDTNTTVIPSMTVTGGSMGTGSACEAVRLAALKLADRLRPVREQMVVEAGGAAAAGAIEWHLLIAKASADLVDLSAEAQFVAPGKKGLGVGIDGPYAAKPGFSYYNYGAGVSSVEVDVLTGEVELLSSHIVYDCGKSVNPLLDVGQVEGAFVMGLGYFLHEENLWGEDGVLRSPGTWEYKPPAVLDVPQRMHVELLRNSVFEKGVLRSKAVGEPPKILSYSVHSAVRQAVAAARQELGLKRAFRLDVPATVDRVQSAVGLHTAALALRQ